MKFEQEKLYKFLGSGLVRLFKDNKVIVAGGAITSIFCNRDINDIDIYFRDQETMINTIEYLYENGWVVSHTRKATLFKTYMKEQLIQAIYIGYFDSPEEVFKKFDFTVCMGAFDFAEEKFVLHEDFLTHNSQRILKLNGNTSFPIMSALRIDKYKEKGYSISKSEFVKIVLACMNLQIDSYDKLKSHIGGMYGLDLGKVFDETKEFSLSEAIDQLSKVSINDYVRPANIEFDDVDDLIDGILEPKDIQYIEINNTKYVIRKDKFIEKEGVPENAVKVDGKDIFVGKKIYKMVKKKGHKYFSHYRDSFEYKIGETVVAKDDDYNNGRLYCGLRKRAEDYPYCGAMIELEIEDISDIVSLNEYQICIKKAKFIREVPEEEYKNDSN